MDTKQVAERLVELCREGKNDEAKNELLQRGHREHRGGRPAGHVAGEPGHRGEPPKGRMVGAAHDVHAANARGPYVLGDRFAVLFDYELTPKTGPDSGKRTTMEEVAVYTVANGKIVHEEFMY